MKQKATNLFFVALGALFLTGLISCKETTSVINSINPLDITDARVLYTTESTQTKSNASANLFKITANKQTSEVVVRNQDGDPILMEYCSVKNLTEDLIYLAFYTNQTNYEYIVRKSDGGVFVVPVEISQSLRNHTSVDGDHNIYSGGHGKDWNGSLIYKISKNMSNGLSAQQLTNEYWVKFTFLADNAGNLIFNILDDRIVLRTVNGIFCLSDIRIDCNRLFTLKGKNGFFLLEGTQLYSFIPNEKTAKIEKALITSYPLGAYCGEIFEVIYKSDKTLILCEGGILIMRDVDNLNLVKFPLNKYQYGDMRIVDKYYYWNEQPGYTVNNRIVRFDVEKEMVENVFYNENYTVENFVCDIDGGVVFTGMNLMTGRKIRGTVNEGVFSETPLTSDDEIALKVINFIQIK